VKRSDSARVLLPHGFYARPSRIVAPALLGRWIISTVGGHEAVGRIVETEAYFGPADEASHAAARIGRTNRNQTMFGPPGIAYVYRSYGIHWCLNVVTDAIDFPGAVLIRAIEPVAGHELMRERRGSPDDRALGRGPGNLTKALGITGELDHHPLRHPPLVITQGTPVADDAIEVGPRIGISRARDLPLRFFVPISPSVSRR
jgi:DNA-3-methyladenine glycosylase